MSALDQIAEVLRGQASKIEDLSRRVASVVMIGQVKENSGDKVRLEFDEKDASTGQPFRSPMVRRANSAGVDGTGHKERSRPAIGETMAMISPNGEIGPHSRVIPYGPTDDSGEPAGDDDCPFVKQVGSARFVMKDGCIRCTVNGEGFELTSAGLQMLGTFKGKNGSRPAHYVGGLDSAGDTAVSGNNDVLI